MKLHNISELDFHKIDGSRQVIANEHARKFAALELNDSLKWYGISWRSELVDPIIKLSKDKLSVWIGVDQQLGAISLATGRIYVALTLNTNILQILSIDTLTAVLAETDVLLFNADFSIANFLGLPDVAEEISISGKSLVIQLMGGSSLIWDTQTGTVSCPEYA